MVDQGQYLDCNQAALKTFGCSSKEEMMSITPRDFSAPKLPDGRDPFTTAMEYIAEARKKGSVTFEWLHRKKDGTLFPTEEIFCPLKIGGREILQAIIRDITDRKQAEKALRDSEVRYRGIFSSATDAIFITDLKGNIVEANPQACEMYGYSYDELIRLNGRDLVYPDYRPHIDKTEKELTSKGELPVEFSIETVNVRKDGTPIDIEYKATKFDYKEKRHFLVIVRDITQRKKEEQERKRLETQLQQARKMEAIGTLAGGIAHDFNNLLMGLQGSISLISYDFSSAHPHFETFKGMEELVQRGADLTKQLLGFARGGKYEVKPTNINELILKSSEMFGRTKKEIRIFRKFQEDLWTAEVDRGQIEQGLLNIYVNAWQAMPEGGELYLQTENVLLDADYAAPFMVPPGNYVKISITDTGVGMDEEVQKHIFDPFFTTKDMGGGTGLGLASTYGIIKHHGGGINVYSVKGTGSTFTIYLPASEKPVEEEKKAAKEIARGQEETVLLVDDEEMILKVGEKILKTLGYRAMSVRNGMEAVKIYEENKGQIDMIILDMIMPGMGGGETFDRLKEMNPEIKVLLSSGYSLDGQASEILERGCRGFIQKPFDLIQLSQKLREILDK